MVTEYTAEGDLCGGIYFPSNHFTYRARKVPTDDLPMRQGCRDELACNRDRRNTTGGIDPKIEEGEMKYANGEGYPEDRLHPPPDDP